MGIDDDGGGASIGGGELAAGVETSIRSGGSPRLLPAAVSLSLGFRSLLPCMEMSLAEASEAPLASAESAEPFQLGSSQATPVKLFNWKPLRCHLRHGVPVLSRALRLALMKPVLALGPSL